MVDKSNVIFFRQKCPECEGHMFVPDPKKTKPQQYACLFCCHRWTFEELETEVVKF